MQTGVDRTTRARTGMTVQTAAPFLADRGLATVNDLPADVLRAFEDFLPVNPPIYQAGLAAPGTRRLVLPRPREERGLDQPQLCTALRGQDDPSARRDGCDAFGVTFAAGLSGT